MSRFSAVVVAAGRSRRMGTEDRKVFLEIAGRPVVVHALLALANHPSIHDLIVVVAEQDIGRTESLLAQHDITGIVVPGGDTRRDSVQSGLRTAEGDLVLIHDGARPFPSSDLIDRVIEGTLVHGACVPVLPTFDTLRTVTNGFLEAETIDRTRVFGMQTPQGFRTEEIRSAIETSPSSIPDDADALLRQGVQVHTVLGERGNLKVTVPEDLPLAEAILAAQAKGI